ncbi:NCS2 family permease [candidate division WOR-3 bacterium]|nr:NCS2 family permease [candidate division WOR-3 bacterium]
MDKEFIKREFIAGLTTFMTMSYIIFVQPAVLSAAGMDFGAVTMATILSSAIATILMGVLARYPIALAPAMGENFFFAYTICLGMGVPWDKALGIVFISGVLFVILTLVRAREAVINGVPENIKKAISTGIGLLITFIGLQWSGVIGKSPSTGVTLGNLHTPYVLTFLIGFLITVVLYIKKVKGALLLGIIGGALAGIPLGVVKFSGFVSVPPSIAPTFMKMDVLGVLRWKYITPIVVLFLLDFFDTVGTLIGVGSHAGFIKDGKLPRAKQALLADSIGTVAGAMLGTSTVTSYIESATGVSAGGRTGLTAIFTALFFLLSMFFYPVVKAIGGGFTSGNITYYPVIAPALVMVGVLMMKGVKDIEWDKLEEALPAFLVIVGIPFTYSISDGMAWGFISYPLVKVFSGKYREVHPVMWVLFGVFLLKYILVK